MILQLAILLAAARGADDPPLSRQERAELERSLDDRIRHLSEAVKKDPSGGENYSRRGDAYFMRARFAEAVADYEKTVELDPSLGPGHWRRGIAYFYAGQYEKAARQFEDYRTQDDVDRENGIWRYFSQVKAFGKEKARAGLLRYAKDDREPFPDVYQLFEGKRTASQIIEKIEKASISDQDRKIRSFYSELYIGLNFAVEDQPAEARKHLRKAVENPWPRGAGFGPDFMWHVGRIHFDRLSEAEQK